MQSAGPECGRLIDYVMIMLPSGNIHSYTVKLYFATLCSVSACFTHGDS